MGREQYQDVGVWLREYIDYAPDAELMKAAQEGMRRLGVGMSDVYDVIANGEIVFADRDHNGCVFVVKGRNCDETEITIYGGFEASSLRVVVDDIC